MWCDVQNGWWCEEWFLGCVKNSGVVSEGLIGVVDGGVVSEGLIGVVDGGVVSKWSNE